MGYRHSKETAYGESHEGAHNSSWTEWAKDKVWEGLGKNKEAKIDQVINSVGKCRVYFTSIVDNICLIYWVMEKSYF